VFQRKMLEICQPPKTASTAGWEFPMNAWPLPNGSCQIPLALIECLLSKSDVL